MDRAGQRRPTSERLSGPLCQGADHGQPTSTTRRSRPPSRTREPRALGDRRAAREALSKTITTSLSSDGRSERPRGDVDDHCDRSRSALNVAVVNSPTGTNQQFGAALDGSLDVSGDGLSDLLVGTLGDGHAYLFLGVLDVALWHRRLRSLGRTPISGRRWADWRHRQGWFQDLAIADLTAQQVFIFKGGPRGLPLLRIHRPIT